MTVRIAVVADGSAAAGLGHLSRSTAVAHALAELEADVEPLALGAPNPASRDGLDWRPLDSLDSLDPGSLDAALLDGYGLDPSAVDAVADRTTLGWFDDTGEFPAAADLVIAPARAPQDRSEPPLILGGLEHAPLGRAFWSPAARQAPAALRRVLVTMGGTDAGQRSLLFAGAVRAGLPEADVVVVRGPNAEVSAGVAGISVIGPLADLAGELAGADLVVGAGGQTMLEAAALGTPALVAVAAPNQAAGVEELRRLGAVEAFDLDDPADVGARVAALSRDLDRLGRMSTAGQAAVDGGGARRVARALFALVADED